MEINNLKKQAAEEAVDEVKDGMIIGLGTGSTVRFALERIAEKIKSGLLKNIRGVPTSKHTEEISQQLGIPIITLDEAVKRNSNNQECSSPFPVSGPRFPSSFCIDITIDGADEVDECLNLIKGGGGAMLREKIVAQASKRLIIIVDKSKLSKHLGEKWPVPVEVIRFALGAEKQFLESIGASVTIRKNSTGENYITDEGNFILDASFGRIEDAQHLSHLMNQRAGIVEHGIFTGLTDMVVCAVDSGIKKMMRK